MTDAGIEASGKVRWAFIFMCGLVFLLEAVCFCYFMHLLKVWLIQLEQLLQAHIFHF